MDDPFFLALAKGGFQVGELAKCYFPSGVEVKTDPADYAGAIAETDSLLKQENATIFEAAVCGTCPMKTLISSPSIASSGKTTQ